MSKYIIPALGVLALAACGQQAQVAEAPQQQAGLEQPIQPAAATMTQAQFVQAVANVDTFEIQASQLAPQRAARQDVKDVAAEVVRANETAARELAQLAPAINVATPAAQLEPSQTAALERLRGAQGEAFDDAYLDAQVESHENAVRLFEQYAQNGEAGPLRDWAQATLPSLRQHHQRIQTLENAT